MLKKILKSSSTFLTINILNTLVQLILISVYITSFSPKEYGVYALFSSFIAFITIFSSANLKAAVQTFFFDFTDPQKQFSYLQSIFSIALLIAILSFVLLLIISPSIFGFIFKENDIAFDKYALVVFGNAAVASLNYIYYEFLRNKQFLKEYSLLMIFQSAINLILQVILIQYFKLEVMGAFLGLLFSNLVIFSYIIINQRLITFDIDKTLIKKSLRYSLWMMPFLFIQWFMTRADRLIIENFIGLSEVGIYALMMNLSMIVSMVATSVLNSFRPSLFLSFKQEEGIKKIVFMHFILYSSIIFTVSGLIFLLVQRIDTLPIDQAYHAIKPIIGLALVLFGIRVIIRFFNEYLIYQKNSGLLSLLTISGALIYALLIGIYGSELTIPLLLKILMVSNSIVLCCTLWATKYHSKNVN